MSNKEPLALLALKLPHWVFTTLTSIYMAAVLLPSKLLFGLTKDFLISKKFEKQKYYVIFGLLRGLIGTLIFTMYSLAMFFGVIALAAWDIGTIKVGKFIGLNIVGFQNSLLDFLRRFFTLLPNFSFFKSLEASLDTIEIGAPSDLSFWKRSALYGVCIIIVSLVIRDQYRYNRKLEAKTHLLSGKPQKGMFKTGLITIWFFQDLLSIVLTIPILLTYMRISEVFNKNQKYEGKDRTYLKTVIYNCAILLFDLESRIPWLLCIIIGSRKTEYKELLEDRPTRDIKFLFEINVLGFLSVLDLLCILVLTVLWIPALFLNHLSLKKLIKEAMDYNWARRAKMMLKLASENCKLLAACVLVFPFVNMAWTLLTEIRRRKLYKKDTIESIKIVTELRIRAWDTIKLRFRFIAGIFVPNRLAYFCKMHCLASEHLLTIPAFILNFKITAEGEEEELETKLTNLVRKQGTIKSILFVFKKISTGMGLSEVGRRIKVIKKKEGEVEVPTQYDILMSDFQFFRDTIYTELWISFKLFLACFLNPITGIQLIYFIVKVDSNQDSSIKHLNRIVNDCYPLIFFDVFAIAIAPLFILIVLLIEPRGNSHILAVIFFGTTPSEEYADRFSGIIIRPTFFFKLWLSIFVNFKQFFNATIYFFFLPLYMTSPELHSQMRKFRKKHWFEVDRVRSIDRRIKGVFWIRLRNKMKGIVGKFTTEEQEMIKDVQKFIDQGVWAGDHLNWDYINEKGELAADSPSTNTMILSEEELKLYKIKGFMNDEEGEFERKVVHEVYYHQANFVYKMFWLRRYEKFMNRLMKSEMHENETEELSKHGLEGEELKAYYFKHLKSRVQKLVGVMQSFKHLAFKKILYTISLTLLWRAYDMQKFLNSSLLMNVQRNLEKSNNKAPGFLKTYFRLYKVCWILLVKDWCYWWSVYMILKVDNNYYLPCMEKVAELEVRKQILKDVTKTEIEDETKTKTEKPQEEGEPEEGAPQPEVEQQVETTLIKAVEVEDEDKKENIHEIEVSNLDTLPNINFYVINRREVMIKYAKYSLNERLQKVMNIFGIIFPHRKEMIDKIMQLKRVPQLQNIDSRLANVLVLKILMGDIKMFFLLSISFFINPLRLYSFFIYCKRGLFKPSINPTIDFDRFQNYNTIINEAKKKSEEFCKATLKSIGYDLLIYVKSLVFLLFPLRLLSLSRIILLTRLKLRKKKRGDDLTFNDGEFSIKLNERMNEILQEVRQDISSMFSIFVIFIGIYEVKNTWKRVHVLIRFGFKQTITYRVFKKIRTMTYEQWFEILRVWWLLSKVGVNVDKLLNREELTETKKNRVLFKEIGWQSMIEFGEYLTPEDKMVLCTVNKRTRKFYMENSVIWLRYYKQNIESNALEIESFRNVSFACLAHYRTIIAERNLSKERDFNLGIRYILKEQAIRSIISFPDLISTPYKVVSVICDKLKIQYQPPNTFVTGHREEADQFYGIQNTNVPLPVALGNRRKHCYCLPRYPATFRNNFRAATGNITEEMESIPRIKGFLHLEKLFYKIVIILGGIHAYIRSIFFYKITFNPGNPFPLAVLNFLKSMLQIVYFLLLLTAGFYYIKFLMSFGCDFITAIMGPFCLNLLLGFHLVREVRNNPVLHKEDFDLRTILKCITNMFSAAIDVTAVPFFRFAHYLLTRFFFGNLIPAIVSVFKAILSVYESTLKFPTKLLTGRGRLLELIHLPVVLIWVLWPQAFIWGFWDFEDFRGFQLLKIGLGFLVGGIAMAWGFINYASWISGSWAFLYTKVATVGSYVVSFRVFQWIFSVYGFTKRIWVIGFIIRLIERLIFFILGQGWNLLMFIPNIKGQTMNAVSQTATGGGTMSKIVFSVIIFGLKITRATLIIKEVSKEKKRA